jgi:hypothetical protein
MLKYVRYAENSRTYNFVTGHITASNLPSLLTNLKVGEEEPLNPHLHPVDTYQLISTLLTTAQKQENPKTNTSMTTNSQFLLGVT